MDSIVKLVAAVSLKGIFWGAVIFTFLPILTLVVSTIIVSLNGTVVMDLYYMVQMWLPFNLNVILLWSVTIALAFATWWIASWTYEKVKDLLPQEF